MLLPFSNVCGYGSILTGHIYGLYIDHVCSVKMAGYWPSSFIESLWTERQSRFINSQKRNEANFQPS